MKTIIFTSTLAVLALLLSSADGQARGFRGGYGAGGLRMGSVAHSRYYNRGYDYDDGGSNTIVGYNYPQGSQQPAVRHQAVAAAPVDPGIREGSVRPVALGTAIAKLPRGYHRYRWNQAYYYYCPGGVWYVDGTGDGSGYAATNPPPGVTVVALLGQTQHVVVGGQTLYLCAGIYYKAIWTNGQATYVVVKKP